MPITKWNMQFICYQMKSHPCFLETVQSQQVFDVDFSIWIYVYDVKTNFYFFYFIFETKTIIYATLILFIDNSQFLIVHQVFLKFHFHGK